MAFSFNQGDRPLPGFTIQRGVGRGGFGEVYYAVSDGGKEVALKYLRENPDVELRGVSHCLNLKSPYLVAIHDIKQNDENDWFVVMEYVNGPSLRDLMMAEPGGLGPQKAAYFLREIAKGMAYLHDRGIVHRDLKPGNIFYEDGYVKIGDYGLAKLMSASQHSGQTVSVGTVHYMAPEVGSGNYDRTIDIYALGVMLYEMLLGRVPFAGATMGEVLMKHLTAQPEVDELPEPFPKVIRKALAKDPKDRYQTVQEMISELFAVQSLDESVASFEADSLTTIAARAAKQMHARQAAGSGGVATLTGVGGSSNTGPRDDTRLVAEARIGLPPGRLYRIQNRVGRGMGRIADRIDGTALAQQINQVGTTQQGHGPRVLIAVLLALGISFGVSLLAGRTTSRGVMAVLVFLNIASIVQGVLVGSWLSYDRLKVVGIWVPRLIIAAIGAMGLLITGEIASALTPDVVTSASAGAAKAAARIRASGVADWAGPLILCLVFGDWAGRLFEGRKGNMSLGSAFSIGLFGFVAGAILLDGQAFKTAVIVAGASLVVQAIGSLWPLPPGAVVPKTRTDNSEEKEEETETESAEPVVVQPPGFASTPARGGRGGPPPIPKQGSTKPPAGSVLAPDASETDPRLRRSTVVRTFWLVASAFALCVGIILYATPHLVQKPMFFDAVYAKDGTPLLQEDMEVGAFSILGTICMALFLFCFTRSWSGYKKGIWRGLIRPAIFFGGAAMSASCGIGMGMFDAPPEARPFLLAGILLGGIVGLLVWCVPVPPYRPRLDETPEEIQKTGMRSAGRLMKAGGIAFGIGSVFLVLILSTMTGADAEEVGPPVAILTLVVSGTLLVSGLLRRRKFRPKPPREEKLTLPLRHVFEIDANTNLARLIERHLGVFGYRLVTKSDLLWSFERGSWPAQFWQSDIRQWKVRFNVAAYELDTGGYRVTCYIDLDTGFSEPDQKQLGVLYSEIRELQGLLSGREVPSAAAVQVA